MTNLLLLTTTGAKFNGQILTSVEGAGLHEIASFLAGLPTTTKGFMKREIPV
jgi:hypothetical protein